MLRKRLLSYGLSFVFIASLGAACATKEIRDGFDDDSADAGGNGSINPGIGGEGGITGDTNQIELEGTTFAPNGELELAGVLVYWQLAEPAEIPEGVYCDTCVELPAGTSTISGADGKFTLKAPVGREIFLVTQKGQFRRVRKVTFAEGDTKIEEEDTTLPGKMRRSAGDTIPTIAIMTEESSPSRDVIHEALDKLGVTEYEFLNGESPDSHAVTEDIDKLSKYQIVMFPCGSEQPTEGDAQTLREYARRGGKIYTSDYAFEYLNKTFEGAVSDMSIGANGLKTCTGAGACGPGRFADDSLSEWMDATGDSSVELEGIYSKFGELHQLEVPGIGDNSAPVVITPKLWSEVQGTDQSWQKASFSVTYGCGRGMFSIFHAHAQGNSLAPQEKALLFMLLEVSSCVTPGGDVH